MVFNITKAMMKNNETHQVKKVHVLFFSKTDVTDHIYHSVVLLFLNCEHMAEITEQPWQQKRCRCFMTALSHLKLKHSIGLVLIPVRLAVLR